MKRVQSIWMVVLLLAVVATGCGAAQSFDEAMAPVSEEMAVEDFKASMPEAEAPAPGAISANAAIADIVDRMIVYTGELSLVVKDTEVAQDAAIALAEDTGGYVSSADSYAYDQGLRRINLTLRAIPTSKTSLLSKI